MKKLQLKSKKKSPYTSRYGSVHTDAHMVVTHIDNRVTDHTLSVRFSVFNSAADVNKPPVDVGFSITFDEISQVSTVKHPDTGDVLQWGKPSYKEVMALFYVKEDGIYIKDNYTADWLLNAVEFDGAMLVDNWEQMS